MYWIKVIQLLLSEKLCCFNAIRQSSVLDESWQSYGKKSVVEHFVSW